MPKQENTIIQKGVIYHSGKNCLIIKLSTGVTYFIYGYPIWKAYLKDTIDNMFYSINPVIDVYKEIIYLNYLKKEIYFGSRFPTFDRVPTSIIRVHKYRFPFINSMEIIRSEEEMNKFFKKIPDDIKKACSMFFYGQWSLIYVSRNNPGFIELIHSNPALAYMLAHAVKFTAEARNGRFKEFILNNTNRKQKEILEKLGFEPLERIRKGIAKILPASVSAEAMYRLREILKNDTYKKRVLKILSHNDFINAGMLNICGFPEALEMVSDSLIQKLFQNNQNIISPEIALTLIKIHNLRKVIEFKSGVFNSVEKIFCEYNRLKPVYKYIDSFISVTIPPPPIPGNEFVKPLSSAIEIVKWGHDQHNCLATLIGNVLFDNKYFYKVSYGKETATVEINTYKKSFEVKNILGPCNAECSMTLKEVVTDWLTNFLKGNKKTA